MHKIALLIFVTSLPLSAGCGQSSMAKVAPEDAYLQEKTRKKNEESIAEKASEELWYCLYRKKSQVALSPEDYEKYIRRIHFWISKGGRVGEGRIACLVRGKKINDAVLKILRVANKKA